MTPKRILVTGGAGFIGSHLVDHLIDSSHQVTVLDNLSSGLRKNLNPKANFYHSSIDDQKKVKTLFKKEKPQVVFHLAANANVGDSFKDPQNESKVAILGLFNLLENALQHKIEKFIFFSSAAVYGEAPFLPLREDDPKNPISFYGALKLACENYINSFNHLYGLETLIFRPANVFGPRQRSNGEAGVVAAFIDNIVQKKPIFIFGDGKQIRDFIYVSDVIEAATLSLRKNLSGIFNLGTAHKTSIFTLANILESIAQRKNKVVYRKDRIGDVKRSVLSFERINKYGWKSKVSLKEGLLKTWQWFQKNS